MSHFIFLTVALAARVFAYNDKTLADLTVTNVGEARGNLYLPPNAPDGSNITWSSSNLDVVTADGLVTRQSQDTFVTLTASVGTGNNTLTRDFDGKVLAKHTMGELAGYGFAFFTGDSIDGENIYFAASQGNNALRWRELNGDKPVLKSIYGTKGLRDPFIMRSAEGDTFYLIATDLSIGSGTSWGDAVRKGSRYLEIWESHDLISWGEQRHVLVSPETAGNTWAPEAFYDDSTGDYVVYWASSLYPENDPDHTSNTYHRMMYATTRDFVTFSEAKIWQDANTSRIDTTMIKNGANFHRFTKDEGAAATGCTDIIQERGTDLLGAIDKWTVIDTCIGKKAGASAVEGPTVFKANPSDENGNDKYYLFVDEFGGRGYIPLETDDIENPNWKVSANYKLPSHPRHGTVIPLTTDELINLNKLMPPIAKANADGQILKYDFSTGINNGQIADQSGNNFTGTVNGGSVVQEDYMIFDGVDDYVTIPNNILSGVDDVSVEMELYINQEQATPFFVYGLGNTAGGIGNGYLYATGSPFKAAVSSSNWAQEEAAGSGSDLARSEWLHIVYTLTNNTAIVYIDGVEVGRLENTKLMPSDIGGGYTSVNHIGKSVYDSDALLNGRVRSFTIYNRALSPTEVESRSIDSTKLMNCQLAESQKLKIPIMVSYENRTVTFGVVPGSDVTKMTPSFETSSYVSVMPSSNETVDMSKPVYYTLTDTQTGTQTAVWTMKAIEMYSPVLTGANADPNIFEYNGTFYLYVTTDGVDGWGSTEFFVWKSTNLADWTRSEIPILNVGGDKSDVQWASGNAWAPTIIERGGKFYFYFSGNNAAVNQKTIGVAWADSPEGPFTADSLAMILNTETTRTAQAIDPAAFKDPKTGKYYLFWGNGTPLYAELSDSMTSLKSTSSKKIEGLTDFREALFVVERQGRYHMTYSIDDTANENYRVGYATAETIDGPWQYRGVLLQKDVANGIMATGHDSIINVPNTDEWYIAYHRWIVPDGDGTHREVVIDKLEVDADGYFKKVTPTLEGVGPIN